MIEAIELEHRFFERYPYLIVDAKRREEIPASWAAVPIAPIFLGNDTARCPLLIDTAAISAVERNALLERLATETAAREETFVSLALTCAKSFARLRRHLIQRIEIPRYKEPSRQFRYFDPGTFIQLPDVIGPAGISWLLGPIDAVAVGWLGEWQRYANPMHADADHFRLREHMDALLAFSVVNRVLMTQRASLRGQQDWRDKANATRAIVDHALATYGLDQRDDLIAFACHAWQWHRAFDSHPTLQTLLAKLAAASPEDKLDYRQLTTHLDKADWQKIAEDLHAATTAEGKPQ